MIAVVGCCLLGLSSRVPAQPEPHEPATKNVLLIFSDSSSAPGIASLDQSLRQAVKEGYRGRVEFYHEYLDQSRFADEQSHKLQDDLLRHKYRTRRIDLIVPVFLMAANYIAEHRQEIFPGVPVIYCGIDRAQHQNLPAIPLCATVLMKPEYKKTLNAAFVLQPGTRRVFVVGGTSLFDQYWQAQARKELSAFAGTRELTYLTDRSMAELKRELARAPRDTIILYLTVTCDRAGEVFTPEEAVDQLASAARAPFYVLVETFLKQGTVGGFLIDMKALGVKTGQLGAAILSGEPTSQAVSEVASVPVFEWPALRRWNLRLDKLPPGSILRHQELGFWDLHKRQIIAALALCGVESLLIIALIIQLRRRRRAERSLDERLRFEELISELSASFVNLPADRIDPAIETGLDKIIAFLNIDRITLMAFSLDRNQLQVTHSRINQTEQTIPDHFDAEKFPWLAERLRCNEKILVSNPSQLPDQAAAEREYLTQAGIRSIATLPLEMGESRLGAISFITLRREQQWSGQLMKQLLLVGEMLANALKHQSNDRRLEQSFDEVRRLKEKLQTENIYLREVINLEHEFKEIVGQSDALKYVLFKVGQVAPTSTTVLILGETGTGKDLVARAIHQASGRADRPLVRVNCAALPASLIESELFGHEKGAFSGAQARRIGRFELAHEATLFLDEIGELPLELQAKLLRVLQDGEFERVGSSQTIKVDVRIIAATNRNLQEEVRHNRFREDLLYRLNVFPISLPPLRYHSEDIPLLVNCFVTKFAREQGKQISEISPDLMRSLQEYPWPGNVRELESVIARAVINSHGPILLIADKLEKAPGAADSNGTSFLSLADLERNYIEEVLQATKGKIDGPNGAAQILKLHPNTLRSRIDKLGIQKAKKLEPYAGQLRS